MKTILGILLLGYWMFEAVLNEPQPENRKADSPVKPGGIAYHTSSDTLEISHAKNPIIYLDAKGNIIQTGKGSP